MTGLVSIPPPSAPCAGDATCGQLVAADGWFDAIDLHKLRDTMRVGTTVTDARLREAVIKGMTDALKDLAIWRTARVLEGIEKVADVPSIKLDGVSICSHHWRSAVYNFAMAQLAETHRDMSATTAGEDRADARALSADDYRRDALHAVRDLLGVQPDGGSSRPRIDVALI